MKLLELEINEIRGIKNLTLTPNGDTIVVWGPNGTGKSGVIDAVDFLLTGKVTRLLGKGTQGLTLKTHGSHIDSTGEDAYVSAKIKIDGINEPVSLKREISNPNHLEVIGCDEDKILPIRSIAERGQHVLTRREILDYITSEPSTRAQQIQTLLNIYEIERIRQNLVKISNKATKSVAATSKAFEQAKFGVLSTTQESSFQKETIIKFVNAKRAVLGGEPIAELNSTDLKKDITPPKLVSSTDTNISLIQNNIENIISILSKKDSMISADSALVSAITEINSSSDMLLAFKRRELIELGISTLEDDEQKDCPLCDSEWEELKLLEYLKGKLEGIDKIGKINQTIESNSKVISRDVGLIQTNLARIQNVLPLVSELSTEQEKITNWVEHLKLFSKSLESTVSNYLSFDRRDREIGSLFSPENINEDFNKIQKILEKKFPRSSPEQDAWDTLTRLEENIKAIESSEKEYNNSKLFEKRANGLRNEFENSRDKILNKLYEEIQSRFVQLYVELHGEDEKGFSAKLEPKGAALNFEVDFHGRGSHPPHALHSEGHQDSMGLCLFLALSEYLAEGVIDVVLLDDVVMSVDADHRRSLCDLMANNFKSKQFIITTHDKTWANQLKTEGIVTSKTSVEFYNWDIDTGPHVNLEKDIWKDVKKALENNNIPEGAAKLRRGAESFFETVCDALEAPVTYRQNRRWELGNFMPSGYSQFKKHLKDAKSAVRSWGNEEKLKEFEELESMASQIYTRTLAEQWGVNSTVHYNEWANLTKNDFQPIADSFEDLFNLFLCQSCGGVIRLVKNGMTPEAIKCNCGHVNWNLIKKKN